MSFKEILDSIWTFSDYLTGIGPADVCRNGWRTASCRHAWAGLALETPREQLLTYPQPMRHERSANTPADAILQWQHVEVEQQADVALAEAQVGEALRFMQGRVWSTDFSSRITAWLTMIFYPVTTVERGAVMVQWQIDLPRTGNPVLIELMTEAVFVGVFEQAWAWPWVHAHPSPGSSSHFVTRRP